MRERYLERICGIFNERPYRSFTTDFQWFRFFAVKFDLVEDRFKVRNNHVKFLLGERALDSVIIDGWVIVRVREALVSPSLIGSLLDLGFEEL